MASKILTRTEYENYNLLDTSFRKDINLIKFHKSNTIDHELAKAKLCYFLLKNNRKFITEGRFKNGLRADIIDLSFGVCYEVTHSEKEESILIKKDKYPLMVVNLDSKFILSLDYNELPKYLN